MVVLGSQRVEELHPVLSGCYRFMYALQPDKSSRPTIMPRLASLVVYLMLGVLAARAKHAWHPARRRGAARGDACRPGAAPRGGAAKGVVALACPRSIPSTTKFVSSLCCMHVLSAQIRSCCAHGIPRTSALDV